MSRSMDPTPTRPAAITPLGRAIGLRIISPLVFDLALPVPLHGGSRAPPRRARPTDHANPRGPRLASAIEERHGFCRGAPNVGGLGPFRGPSPAKPTFSTIRRAAGGPHPPSVGQTRA